MAIILIVEDDEDSRDMLAKRLLRQDFTVIVAKNGKEGVAKAISERPHLIIMDITMPVMDGWKATEILKDDRRTRKIPIIALTARSSMGDVEESLHVGCDSYEAKPVNFTHLMRKIKKFI